MMCHLTKKKIDLIFLFKNRVRKSALLKCVNGFGILNVGNVKMNPSTQYVNKQHEHYNMELYRHLLPSSHNFVTKNYVTNENGKKVD